MDTCNNPSVLLYRQSKPVGKVRRRVLGLRVPSSSYGGGSELDLSHNESARLAADSLLSQGLERYHMELKAEGEVDFLSELDKDYILRNGRDPSIDDGGEANDVDKEFRNLPAARQSHCSCALKSSDSAEEEEGLDQNVHKVDPSVDVFLQADRTAAGMKDLVRQFLRKAKLSLAIVMDGFSDPELLCDLLEASRKRNVSVHLLLDHLNLKMFVHMWHDLKLISKNFPNVSVRSVPGQTYWGKTGRKLTGQTAESFIISDWEEVLTGTYSFTWLSGHVHRSLLVLIKGRSVSRFRREFLRLHSSSKPAPGFVTFIALPQSLYSRSRKHPDTFSCSCKSHTTHAGVDLSEQPKDKVNPLLQSSIQTGAEYSMQSPAAGTQEMGNLNQIYNRRDQTHSDVQAQLQIIAEETVEVQEPHALNTVSVTLEQKNYQPGLKKRDSLARPDKSTGGDFSHLGSRNMLAEPSGFQLGTATSGKQPEFSINAYPKHKILQLPSSQQIPSNLQLQISLRGTSRHDEFVKRYQHPQQQADSKRFQSGAQTKMGFHHVTSQQVNLPQRTSWNPQRAAEARAAARCDSFSRVHQTGPAGWRSIQNKGNILLGTSRTMAERRTAGSRGSDLHF